ncbi:MAG TPA: amidohydrolase [Candidatus Thermoplasmatota archaeon]|nr:amidohydrolase [Candidatus Thermoplasmatota archaeon]
MPSLLVKDALLLTQDDQRRVLRGDLRAEDGVITHVGAGTDVPQHADVVVEAGGDLLLPGLVNAHTHSPMTLLRGLGDDLPLEEWLRTRIWPTERSLTRRDVERGVDLAILEMLRTGTTCFNDMYFFAEAAAERAAAAGIRALVASTFFNWDTMEMPVDKMEEGSIAFVRRWAGHPLVTPTLGPHATYTCDDEKLAAVRRVHEATGARVHTHCSETRFEVQDVLARRGARPVEVLRRHGLLRGSILAHCGWVTKEEVRTLAAEGAHVAHCPVSNLKLATGGVMPWEEMREAGVNVALGTDGAASNNTLDVLETAKYAALVQKQHRWDPRAAPAQQVLDAATRGGARACGVGPGALVPGAPCDIMMISKDQPHMAPLHDPVSDVVYSARGSDVRMTVVAGRVLYLDGDFPTMDAAAVMQAARESAERVRKAAGL